MPKKKVVPEPTLEPEDGFVSTGAPVDDPIAASAEITENAASVPDDSAPVLEGPTTDEQDTVPGQETGGVMEPEAVNEAAPEILGLEPEPASAVAEAGGDESASEALDGTSRSDTAGDMPVDIPGWEQSAFSNSEQGSDGAASEADGFPLAAAGLADYPAEVPADAELPGGEIDGAADGEPPEAAERGVQEESSEPEPTPRRRAARRTRRTEAAPEEATGNSAAEAPRASGPRPEPLDENGRHSFYDLDFNALDRDLSPEQRQEWNSIYASYRGRSVLTGVIAGVDRHSVRVRDRRTGEMVRQDMYCATVIPFRVRILIPSTEMWMQGEERPDFVLRNMSGAVIDFVVTHVDREADFAIASRRLALRTRRYYFSTQPSMNRSGARLKCHVLAVGPRRCLVECGGYDIDLTQREMRYTAIPDLREQYHRGDTLDCIVKNYDRENGKLVISVKEINPNPFDGAELRHPEGSRRQAEIAGKYAGGVFCNLPDGVVVMCSYSFHYQPTWDEETLQMLPEETRERWLDTFERDEDAEDLVMETLAVLMAQTHNYPLSLELTQYLVTYTLAVELSEVQPEAHPRKETARCIKLAKYLTPWERPHTIDYICHKDGEVFLLDGEIDQGSCEDYLDAIRQAEKSVAHDDLKRYLKDRTAQPCFDFELEKAVHIWLGDEYKRRGVPVE